MTPLKTLVEEAIGAFLEESKDLDIENQFLGVSVIEQEAKARVFLALKGNIRGA